MISTLLMSLFSIFFDLLAILRISKSDKDLEIIILRQQVRLLQRKVKTPPRIYDPERMILATLVDKYTQFTVGARQHLNQVMLIFKPDRCFAGIENWFVVSVLSNEKENLAGQESRLNLKH